MKRSSPNPIKHIPNTLTLLNLLSGSLAVLMALNGYLQVAAILVLTGFVFDLFDGVAARLLKAQSPIGKELDSLADLISFGLAPACILFGIQEELGEAGRFSLALPTLEILQRLIPFILPVFAALRLAKFNIDERQSNQFIGLPTPANGLMVLALPLALIHQPESFLINWLNSDLFVPIYTVAVSYLMVSPLRLYSIKIKGLGISQNRNAIIIAFISLGLILTLGYVGIFLVIPAYMIFAAILAAIKKE